MNLLHEMCVWGVVAATDAASAAAPAAETTAQTPGGGSLSSILPIVALVAIMYFLLFRPQQKRERQRTDMLSKLSKGDRVLTSGGIFGTVIGLTEQMVVLRISEEPPVKVEFLKSAVARVIPKGEEKQS